MLFIQAATMLRDTVFVSMRETGSARESWAFGTLMAVIGGLSTWALIRSVEHGQRLQKIETFVGVENEDGLSGKIDKVTQSSDALVLAVQAIALDIAILKERGLQHIRTGS